MEMSPRLVSALLATVALCGCAASGGSRLSPAAPEPLVFLTRPECFQTTAFRRNLELALTAAGRPITSYTTIDLDTLPESDIRRGYPTPTLLQGDRDAFGMAPPQPPLPEPT